MPAYRYWVTRQRRDISLTIPEGYDEYRDGKPTGWLKLGSLCVLERNGNYYFRSGSVYLPGAIRANGLAVQAALAQAEEWS